MMAATICLYKSSQLGFDLDTRRPLFHDSAEADTYMSGRATYTYRSSNFNKIGDPMLLPLKYSEASHCDVGTFTFDGDGTTYWFRIRDIYVNETNRTQADYDIDYVMTFAGHLGRGHIDRVPKGNPHARGMPVNPKFWKSAETKVAPMFDDFYVVFVLKQMKSSSSQQNYDITGPIYCVLTADWYLNLGADGTFIQNPINETSALSGQFAVSDIVNAWIVPKVVFTFDYYDRSWKHWSHTETLVGGVTTTINWSYTNCTAVAYWFNYQNIPTSAAAANITETVEGATVFKGTNTAEGRVMGICDERGNVLYNFQDMQVLNTGFTGAVYISMASCEVDIFLSAHGETGNGARSAHLANRLFTYSCRPIDVMADSWQDYLFRQRAADIEGRKIQNDAALAGGVGNAASGALMGAAMGSVVPGLGTVAGAIAGGLTSIVGSAVNYGVQSYYGDKQQALVDKTFQLAQDQVAVNGMITSRMIKEKVSLFVYMVEVDEVTAGEIAAECAITGVPADGFTSDMSQEMADAMNDTEFLPWACTAEVDDSIDIPASWKRIVSEQLRKGACYKKFGAWPS